MSVGRGGTDGGASPVDAHRLLMPEAILFDMDGTVVDSEPLWFEAEGDIVRAFGGAWTDADHEACVGTQLEKACAYMLTKMGAAHEGRATAGSAHRVHADPVPTVGVHADRVPAVGASSAATSRATRLPSVAELAQMCMSRMEELLLAGRAEPVQGVLRLIREAHEAEIPIALVSASHRRLMDPVVAQLDRLLGRSVFDETVAGDEVAEPKPHPEAYLKAARALGVDPRRCAIVEDSPSGTASGYAAGGLVLAVPSVMAFPVPQGVHALSSADELSLAQIGMWMMGHRIGAE